MASQFTRSLWLRYLEVTIVTYCVIAASSRMAEANQPQPHKNGGHAGTPAYGGFASHVDSGTNPDRRQTRTGSRSFSPPSRK